MAATRIFTRSFTTANLSSISRRATGKDMKLFTQRSIAEGKIIGPYDFDCGFAFDPKGFFVREIGGELVNHATVVRYPSSHSHIGGSVVTEKYRKRGHFTLDAKKVIENCYANYTIGVDIAAPQIRHSAERAGFTKIWDTYVASFDLQTVAGKLKLSNDLHVKPLHEVNFEKLLEYDHSVFGTDRRVFMERWISAPGSFGYVAVDRNDKIVGYAVLKSVIKGGGTEIGLAIAPLYSDDPHIAKCLLKTAAERCLANEAVPKTKLEMFHPVGDICGKDAPLLMKELEAELTYVSDRMYTKGVPFGRQTKKIYGITSPIFD